MTDLRAMSAQIFPLATGDFLALHEGKLWWGKITRQKPNDQMKLCIEWREMNLPGQPMPYSELTEQVESNGDGRQVVRQADVR